jgi:hypothetical protein
MIAAKAISKLLVNVPKGAWVALSSDESRVVAFASELQDVLAKSKELGEKNPVVMRAPDEGSSTLFV